MRPDRRRIGDAGTSTATAPRARRQSSWRCSSETVPLASGPAHERAARSAGPKGASARDCAAPTTFDMRPRSRAEARMSAWQALDAELDRWRSTGRRATLWCRDDDAFRDSPPLQRFLEIAEAAALPVALAAI